MKKNLKIIIFCSLLLNMNLLQAKKYTFEDSLVAALKEANRQLEIQVDAAQVELDAKKMLGFVTQLMSYKKTSKMGFVPKRRRDIKVQVLRVISNLNKKLMNRYQESSVANTRVKDNFLDENVLELLRIYEEKLNPKKEIVDRRIFSRSILPKMPKEWQTLLLYWFFVSFILKKFELYFGQISSLLTGSDVVEQDLSFVQEAILLLNNGLKFMICKIPFLKLDICPARTKLAQ